MAVMRNSDAVQFNVADNRQVATPDIAVAPIRPNQEVLVGDDSWRTKLVESLAGNVNKVLGGVAEQAQMNAYLEGQAKVGRIKSEDEIEGDFMTRDWEVAGYRDSMGRLAMAQAQQKFEEDLPKLVTQTPADVEAYIANRRTELTPVLASMSRKQRAAHFVNMAIQEQADMSKYTEGRKKYILAENIKSAQASVLPSLDALASYHEGVSSGKTSGDSYNSYVQAATGSLITNVWENANLPHDAKVSFTKTYLKSALDRNLMPLYEYVMSGQLKDASGNTIDPYRELDQDTLQKLGDQYRGVYDKQRDQRNSQWHEQTAMLKQSLQDGTFTGSYEDVLSQARSGLALGLIKGGEYQTIVDKYLEFRSKGHNQVEAAQAWRSGNTQFFSDQGKDTRYGFEAQQALWAKNNTPLQQQVPHLIEAANTGMPEAPKYLGQQLGIVMNRLTTGDGKVDPSAAKMFNTVVQAVESAKDPTYVEDSMLAGMTQEQRDSFQRINSAVRSGLPVEQAVERDRAVAKRISTMDPQARAMASATALRDFGKLMSNVGESGPFGRLYNTIVGAVPFIGEDNAQLNIVQPSRAFFENATVSDLYQVGLQGEMAASAARIAKENPLVTGEQLMQSALADVAGRTLRTKDGPLFIPQGSSYAKLFEAKNNVSQTVASSAIERALPRKTDPSGKYHLKFDARGNLTYQEYDKNGTVTSNFGTLNPSEVRGHVESVINRDKTRASELFGKGRVGGTDIKINYDGRSSLPVAPELMLSFRDTLVKHEGVRDVEYPDASNKDRPRDKPVFTAGVGVSTTNPYYPKIGKDGKISKEEIERSFTAASDDAARQGLGRAKMLGLQDNPHAFLLLSELAYQGMGNTKKFMQGLELRDKALALEGLRESRAYGYSQKERRKNYEKLLDKTLGA